ncbi:checkpoint protein HUS1 isoform X2 [Hyalella azteca]|uniref:Checkpoint protein n=1 Tax=Hyalella azteca TaxID=294128 RepID=A0A8B7NCP5_HYAAZ|nr:checkpoint protein HUS1 isoform X2 [Hyalella azteca]
MKFRGKIIEIGCIRQFTQLITDVSRLAKSCILRLNSNHVCLVVSDGGALGGTPGLWAELEQQHYFSEYSMEGVSEENQIFLELQTDKLAKTLSSLRSSQSTRSLKIKLTKKLSPCLTFEIELPSASGRSRLVLHDVPVSLIPRRLWAAHQEPRMSHQFDVSIYLPPIKTLRHVVDRMKTFSSRATLSGSRSGTLVVSVSNSEVAASTHFRNLTVPAWDADRNDDPETAYGTSVDIKKLSSFLQGDHNTAKVICNIVSGRLVHLFLMQEGITLQYFLPAVSAP